MPADPGPPGAAAATQKKGPRERAFFVHRAAAYSRSQRTVIG